MDVADGIRDAAQGCCGVSDQAGGEGLQSGGSAVQVGAAGEGTAQSSARANMLAVRVDAVMSNGTRVEIAILVMTSGSSVESGRTSVELVKSASESMMVANMLILYVYMLRVV